jgi:predicted NUDIX family NTP pyrophosphohydrolase
MKNSAGLLMYQFTNEALQIFLAHPGGPFYKNKDDGCWTIPKGLINDNEDIQEAAKREFEEETGIDKSKINLIENIIPFEETFIGSNHKSYKHKYFLAYYENSNELLNNYQKTEVSKMEWKTLEQCLDCIRPYNLEKKELIQRIYKVIQEYRLYC